MNHVSPEDRAKLKEMEAAGYSCKFNEVDLNPSLTCANSACDSHTTGRSVQLFSCSSCKVRKYCSLPCQKKSWKSHKSECAAIASLIKQESKRDPKEKEFLAYKSVLRKSLQEELRICAGSGLLLGKPESKGDTHFLALHLTYHAPNMPLSNINDVLAVRKLFTLEKVEVTADDQASESLKCVIKSMRAYSKYKLVYFAFIFTNMTLSEGHNFVLGDLGIQAAYDQHKTFPANPFYKEFLMKSFRRKDWSSDEAEMRVRLNLEDLSWYVHPEDVERQREGLIRASKMSVKFDKTTDIKEMETFQKEWKRICKEEGEEKAFEWMQKKALQMTESALAEMKE